MKVIGFSSGAAGRMSNVDRMVQAVIEKSGDEGEFVKLSDLDYSACQACVDLCAGPQSCQLDDDLLPYFEKIREADAVVLGAPVYFGTINAGMMSFTERFFGFRHVTIPIAHKPFALVIGGSGNDFTQGEHDFRRRMNAFAVNIVDVVRYNSQIPPCYSCGRHTECVIGGLYYREGKAALTWEVTPESFNRWEDQPAVCEAVDAAAVKLWDATNRLQERRSATRRGKAGLSIMSMLQELLENEQAKAVLDKWQPGFADSPGLQKALGMSLQQIASYPNGWIGDEVLQAIDEELARL